jgi:hypothetical protein
MKYKVTKIFSLLTPLLLVIVVFLGNAGHGSYAPMMMLFPTATIGFPIMGGIEWPFIILGIIQFPVYGLLIDRSANKPKTAILLSAFHFAMMIITFVTTRDM